MKKKKGKTFQHTIASGIASFTSTFLFHPFETVRARLQVFDGSLTNPVPKYKGVFAALKSIYQNEGLLTLYRGFGLNLTGNCLANMMFFSIYSWGREKYNFKEKPTPLKSLIISSQAAVLATTAVCPVWLLKLRMMLYPKHLSQNKRAYQILIQIIKDIFKNENVFAFYKGYVPSLWLCIYGIIQMMSYEFFKIIMRYDEDKTVHSKNQLIPLFIGSLSKGMTTTFLYPLTTVRARIQQRQITTQELQSRKTQGLKNTLTYSSTFDCIRKTYINEGALGFYKGLTASLIKVLPTSAVFFFIYELTLKLLKYSSQIHCLQYTKHTIKPKSN